MLNRHTPKSHCSKDKENPLASISYRSEGIESTTLSEGDYKGNDGNFEFLAIDLSKPYSIIPESQDKSVQDILYSLKSLIKN
jgi:hypothetical protein